MPGIPILAPKKKFNRPVRGRMVASSDSSRARVNMPPPPAGQGTIAYGHTTYARLLGSKQGISSTTNAPTHSTGATEVTEEILRADALANFATSINANQPVAAIVNRVKILADEVGQFAEIEGRALPVAAYFLSYLRYLLYRQVQVPGYDKALANNTQTFAQYRCSGLVGKKTNVTIQNVINQQPYTGSGALSSYAENDGGSGEYDDSEEALADYFVARAYGSGISAVNIKKCRAFMIAAAADIDSGFTIKAGNNVYITEEINDSEDRINEYLGYGDMSITGAAAAAYRSARGQPQDPFTGAAVFLFADLLGGEPQLVNITLNTAQAIQLAALSDDGIGAFSSQ